MHAEIAASGRNQEKKLRVNGRIWCWMFVFCSLMIKEVLHKRHVGKNKTVDDETDEQTVQIIHQCLHERFKSDFTLHFMTLCNDQFLTTTKMHLSGLFLFYGTFYEIGLHHCICLFAPVGFNWFYCQLLLK